MDRPYDATPPPGRPKPVLLSKTSIRAELDFSKMLGIEYRQYWAWVLRHANLTLVIPKGSFPVSALAKECWDPCILTNLGAVVARPAISLAKREAKKENVCCIFRRDSYSVHAAVFASPQEMLEYYEHFAMNCRFLLKGLERELRPTRENRYTVGSWLDH